MDLVEHVHETVAFDLEVVAALDITSSRPALAFIISATSACSFSTAIRRLAAGPLPDTPPHDQHQPAKTKPHAAVCASAAAESGALSRSWPRGPIVCGLCGNETTPALTETDENQIPADSESYRCSLAGSRCHGGRKGQD
jgi:hypothetical protein